MVAVLDPDQRRRLRDLAARHPPIQLLLLFGSRAEGATHRDSDWDFGFLSRGAFDVGGLAADLGRALGTDAIDLVDLSRAGGLLRYRAAERSSVVHEAEPGAFARFWMEAVGFWCDAEPILRRGYETVLRGLGP